MFKNYCAVGALCMLSYYLVKLGCTSVMVNGHLLGKWLLIRLTKYFHGISVLLLVLFFTASVFGVGIFFWLRLFQIVAYLYLSMKNILILLFVLFDSEIFMRLT